HGQCGACRMNRKRLLQMSGVVVDLVYRIDSLPRTGEEVVAKGCMITAGGGFNAMIAASRAGMDVAYGGGHGFGLFADLVRGSLQKNGIGLLQDQSSRADQGSCVVIVDDQGERTFISKDGAEGILDRKSLAAIDATAFDWILLSGYTLCYPDSRDALHEWLVALPEGANFVFDPSPVVEQIPAPVLRTALSMARWISANGREAAVITGIASPRNAAEALAAMMSDVGHGAVVRCGSEGCWLALPGGPAFHLPGFIVNCIDSNGAGDTHVGTFIAALSKGLDPIKAARYGNAAAALSTTRPGAATAPNDLEIRNFLGQNAPSHARGGIGVSAG
ncbi:MAG: PfkB family carbohydrate kinase, partial [Alphaproteobacteria bacterium]